jgi:serine/threonine-protein kinase
VAERAVRLDEHLALTRVALGTVYAESGRYDEALRELEAALQLEPSNAGAYRGLGIAHKHRGESALAAGAFEKAVEGKPTDPFLRDELGLLYYNGGRYDEAEAQFLKSVESAPDRAYGYRNLSAVYYMQGRLPEAAEALQKALVIKPEHSLYSNLGTILFAQGLYLLSAQAFEKALDHGGANVYLYWANLADAYRQAEGYDEEAREAYLQAIRLLETEVEAQPGNDVLVTRLALYLAKSGDREAALAVLEAADLEEGQASDHYRGAVAYEICGERTAALAALATALRAGFSTSEVARDPELFGLRSDPRYHRLVAEIGAR